MINHTYRKAMSGTILGSIRIIVLTIKSIIMLPLGMLYYAFKKVTPGSAHEAMIWLFCLSRGRLTDLMSNAVSTYSPKIQLPTSDGVLGSLSQQNRETLVDKLRKDGFLLFPGQLPDEMCDRLLSFAKQTPAVVRKMDHENKISEPKYTLFESDQPLGVRYDYKVSDLLVNKDIQHLMADGSLLTLAQDYLDCLPKADVLCMWWHTSFHGRPDAEAAQYFHFDMDRIKWLKIFIYLTDVGTDNGPHSFVRGSHRTNGIPFGILRHGYKRLTDEEVHAHYPIEDIISFTAPRGSIIIEDTRGLHKGVHVLGTPRLVLQLQFSNSLFGAPATQQRFGNIISPELKIMNTYAPSIYQQYN